MKLYRGFCSNCSSEKDDFRNLELTFTEKEKQIKCLECKSITELESITEGSPNYYLKKDDKCQKMK